jgi:hypothetical protein
MGYANLKQVKQRVIIEDSVSDSDEKLNGFMVEADSYVNNQISVHATIPISSPDDELVMLSSSLAAATYNYWQTPAKERTLDGITQWETRIQDHIQAVYGKKNPSRS